MSEQFPQDYRPAYGAERALSSQEERNWGAVAHASAVVAMVLSAGFMGFLGSLMVYVLYKERGPFVRAHAANSLNVQITMVIWLAALVVAGIVIGVLTLGLGLIVIVPMFMAAPFVAGAIHVVGAVKAYNGEWWEPPLSCPSRQRRRMPAMQSQPLLLRRPR